MKKLLSSIVAAALALQCGAISFAATSADDDFADWQGVGWRVNVDSDAFIESDAHDLANLGVGWTRIGVGQNSEAITEKMVTAAENNDVNVVLTYNKTAVGNYGTEEEEAAEMEFLTKIVKKYKGITSYWEIGNEPNLNYSDTENYAKHLRDCYNTIKAADKNATVILGGISEAGSEKWVENFANIELDGKKAYEYCDEVAFHPYAANPDASVARLQAFKTAMTTYWGAAKPVWITEIGFHAESTWDTSKCPGYVASEDIKASYLTEVMTKLHNESGSESRPVMWYVLHEDGSSSGYGVVRKTVSGSNVTKTPLAAYGALQKLTGNLQPAQTLVNDTFDTVTETTPEGWNATFGNDEGDYVKVSNTSLYNNTSYLAIKGGNSSSAVKTLADRAFELPEGGGLVTISFDHASTNNNGEKQILLKSGDTTALKIDHQWVNNGNNIRVNDNILCGENNWWRHYDVVANCSDKELEGYAPGEFKLTYNAGLTDEKVVTGTLLNNATTLDKVRFGSPCGWQAGTVGVDNFKVTVIPAGAKSATELPINDKFTETDITIPNGWASNLTENTDNAYVKTSSATLGDSRAHLEIKGGVSDAGTKTMADRAFELPESGALLTISFDHYGTLKGYGKAISLMSGNTTALKIDHQWVNNGNYISVDNDILHGENDWWRHYNIVVNCSDAEIDGYTPWQYKVTHNAGLSDEGVVTGTVTADVATLDKIRFESPAWRNGIVGVANLKITAQEAPAVLKISDAQADGDNAVVSFKRSKSVAKGDVIVAAYSSTDNRFIRLVDVQKEYLIPKGESSINVPLGEKSENEYYKVFVWDEFNNMVSLTNCKTFNK